MSERSLVGGTITSDISSLAIPLGLILTREGLQRLKAGRTCKPVSGGKKKASSKSASASASASASTSTRRRASLSGGAPARPRATTRRTPSPTRRRSTSRAASPVRRKYKTASASASASASTDDKRHAKIRTHFQNIATRVHEIFAKARAQDVKRRTTKKK